MNYEQRESLISRIISGELYCTVGGVDYVLKQPDKSLRYKAQRIYEECLLEGTFSEWLDETEAVNALIRFDLWKDVGFSAIETRIEELKIELFKSFLQTDKLKDTRKLLNAVRDKYNEMLNTKHSLDYATITGYATMVKSQFLIASGLYYLDGTRVWIDKDISNADYILLENIMSYVNSNRISLESFRELARTEPWRGYWTLNKNSVFTGNVIDWSEEQRTLALFSRMYDSVYDSSECPTDDIINDDDLLDGWMLIHKRKRDKERMETQLESILGKDKKHQQFHQNKLKNAQEVFLPAKDAQEAEKINSLNDFEGRMIKKQRDALIKAKGEVTDSNFQDRKIDAMNKINEQFKQHVKGK